MAYNLNKDVVVYGIGHGLIRDTITGKVLYFDKGQKLTVEHNTTSEDLYGGDSLVAIYTYATQSESTVKLTNATFKPAQLGFMISSKTSRTGIKAQEIVKITKTDTKLAAVELTGVNVLLVADGNDESVEFTSTGTPAETGIDISATGEVKFGATAPEGEYTVVYEYDADGVQTAVLADTLPNPCEIFATFYPEDLDGNKQQMNIYIPYARCDGNVTFETARDSAQTPELTFKILKKKDKAQAMVFTLSERKTASTKDDETTGGKDDPDAP